MKLLTNLTGLLPGKNDKSKKNKDTSSKDFNLLGLQKSQKKTLET